MIRFQRDVLVGIWSLALLLLALGTHAPALPLAAWPAFALALASRRLPRGRWATPLRMFLLASIILAAGLAWGWLDALTLRVALLTVLALKWAESNSAREFALLAGGALVAGTLGLLQWGEWVGLALIALLPFLALVTLESASSGSRPALRKNALRIALALPLTALLFLFFPRIPGPLWDIGMSFGLPLSLWFEPASQGLGVSTRLKPGQNQSGSNIAESRPVLVAEFENWVPPTSMLYWRGPVYYDFDGHEWRIDPAFESGQGRVLMRQGWTKAAKFSEALKRKTHEIRYSVRLSPHDRLWLYGLDLPSRLPAESFVSADWQVLAHQPVKTEMQYSLQSWLEWEAGGKLDESLRQRALALPETGNARLRELGVQLSQQPPDERAIAALALLAKGGFKVRDQFELMEGPDNFDHLWFESKTGNADLYAGAFVFLMRAAGVPARLVTGYRGGKLMALTDYVIVKQSHAHAWAETWDSEKGWRRIDPVSLIAPERFQNENAPKTANAPKPKNTPAPARQNASQNRLRQETALHPNTAPMPDTATAQIKISVAGEGLDEFFSRWLFRLDAEAQRSLLSSLGEKLSEKLSTTLEGGFAWIWLLTGAGLSCVLVITLRAFIDWQRETQSLPAPQRTWNRLVRMLARHGFPRKTGETARAFASRISVARPAWEKPLSALAEAWSDWLYAPHSIKPDASRRIKSAARIVRNLILAEAPAARGRPSV
ncbi:MAG: DUF3488 and transglutaminase-like domain-containing protein [Azoarcus sp.]|nr:DUF3488 and transglutaminase-like domain-containing protein [Azoarcus sp.]